MALSTHRLNGSDKEPFTLEVDDWPWPSTVLWHLSRNLPGLRIIAKKSWALTDDYEAYFIFRGRLFVLYSPFAKIWVSLLGQPAEESLFSEVEATIQKYPWWAGLLLPITFFRYFFTPLNPPKGLVEAHESGGKGERHAV
jgi:hypothetical protein